MSEQGARRTRRLIVSSLVVVSVLIVAAVLGERRASRQIKARVEERALAVPGVVAADTELGLVLPGLLSRGEVDSLTVTVQGSTVAPFTLFIRPGSLQVGRSAVFGGDVSPQIQPPLDLRLQIDEAGLSEAFGLVTIDVQRDGTVDITLPEDDDSLLGAIGGLLNEVIPSGSFESSLEIVDGQLIVGSTLLPINVAVPIPIPLGLDETCEFDLEYLDDALIVACYSETIPDELRELIADSPDP